MRRCSYRSGDNYEDALYKYAGRRVHNAMRAKVNSKAKIMCEEIRASGTMNTHQKVRQRPESMVREHLPMCQCKSCSWLEASKYSGCMAVRPYPRSDIEICACVHKKLVPCHPVTYIIQVSVQSTSHAPPLVRPACFLASYKGNGVGLRWHRNFFRSQYMP